ncbi:hypothetical protein PILCRDRAFT_70181 [Piloderma croceum F 1598]|uniref:Major facilitator superfamily (MFS) profile domain-containing protein n=1 Tax=Piloderma croceum (strain F 1598) TaxID=765440 RepID=A0A0C3B907_PILCF|nr:hypothetical protein PILCRDRAFT_70181 [Piloderma croceum F 1598]
MPDISTFFICWTLFFPYFYLQLFADLHKLPSTFAFYTISSWPSAASSIFGRTIPNLLADMFGVINVFIVVTFSTCALLFTLVGINGVGGVAIFAIIYGFFSGAVLSLAAPLMASFASNDSDIGTRIGVAYFVNSFTFLTGPPISGTLLGSQINWDKPAIFGGVHFIFFGR